MSLYLQLELYFFQRGSGKCKGSCTHQFAYVEGTWDAYAAPSAEIDGREVGGIVHRLWFKLVTLVEFKCLKCSGSC